MHLPPLKLPLRLNVAQELRIADLEMLQIYLQSGHPIHFALAQIPRSKFLQNKLQSGEPIQQCTFVKNQKLQSHLRFFMAFSSIEYAIQSALTLYHEEKSMMNKLQSQLLYPCVLLFSSSLLMLFFQYSLLPTLNGMIQVNQNQIIYGYFAVQKVLLLGFFLLGGYLIGKGAYLKYFAGDDAVMKNNRQNRIFHFYYSYQFAQYLYLMMETNLSFQQAMHILRNHQTRSIAIIAKRIDQDLLDGNDLAESFTNTGVFHQRFIDYIVYGTKIDQLSKALAMYNQIIDSQVKRFIKRLTIVIQIFAYGSVAITVLLVYQVMLVPLQMLEVGL